MASITVQLETVTPLFLAGADARGTPELRPPAFRGALRYWLRALLGGTYGDDDDALKRVREAEAGVFGMAADDDRGFSSPITIRKSGTEILTPHSFSKMTGWNPATKRFTHRGLAYLFFAARETQGERERSGLEGEFGLTLQTRPSNSNSDQAMIYAYIALWMLTHCGGVGTRVRRGAGAFQALQVQPKGVSLAGLPDLRIQATSAQALTEELGQGFRTIRTLLRPTLGSSRVTSPSSFEILDPQVCKVWVINKTYDQWIQALDQVGWILQGFRNRRQPDYTTVKNTVIDLMDQAKPTSLARPVERAAFGLPITYYYTSLNRQKATLTAEDYDRRASPLCIRVVKLANGKFAVVLLWFQAVFLPGNQQLQLSLSSQAQATGPVPNSNLLAMFLHQSDSIRQSSLRDKNVNLLEVGYA
jgi:CRISPR-associated protein Cmr1